METCKNCDLLDNKNTFYVYVVQRQIDGTVWETVKSFDDFDCDNAVYELKMRRHDDWDGEYRLIREMKFFELIEV